MKENYFRYVFKRLPLLYVTSFLLLSLPEAAFAEWTIETADASKNFQDFNDKAIAIDKVTNQPHIAYGSDQLYHAWFDGTQWHYETVDSARGVGCYASMAIDSNNKIHISYSDGVNVNLKYATNASGSWVTSTIDSTGNVGYPVTDFLFSDLG